jgi:ATP-dependent exoDNAse (exonuclease V) beta subunit
MAFIKRLALEASAGSGKTFALVVRYLSLLFMDVKPNSILALTFTNKAANEMSLRVATVLKELHLPKREAELQEISKSCDISTDEILRKRDEVLKRFLSYDIKISTIDKFFVSILRKFSLYEGLMPDFLVDEVGDQERLRVEFIKRLKQEKLYDTFIKLSIYEDRKLSNIFELLNEFYEKDHELREFSDFADVELLRESENSVLKAAERIRDLFFSCKELSSTAKRGLEFESIDELLQKSWLERDSFNYRTFSKCYKEEADRLLLDLKDELRRYFQVRDRYLLREYLKVYNAYKRAKGVLNKRDNLLEFSDMGFYLYRLLNGRIDRDFLYFRLDSKISHLLIDEFQDTNLLQYRILEPIIEELVSGYGREEFRSFFYVGDVKQSIYRFRGGVKELFYFLAKEYNISIDRLNINYRSDSNIVSFVNSVFKDKMEGYFDQYSNSKEKKGYVKVLESEDIIKSVVDTLFDLIDRGVGEDDIAILVYANDTAKLIEEEIIKQRDHIKVSTESSLKLRNHPKTKAIVNLLKYIYFKDELYLVNFKAFLGLGYDEELDVKGFDTDKKPMELIYEIVDRYELFDGDENIFKLIDLSIAYDDLESFIFAADEMSGDVASKSGEGVKILTIHKSKGLEFDHLIVVDRIKAKNSDKSPFIFSYNDIELTAIYSKSKNREHVDESFKEAKERERELSAEDELNIEYVAFTRAKKSLIVCKKRSKSAFENLSLEPIEIGEIELSLENGKKSKREKNSFEYEPINVGRQKEFLESEDERDSDFEAVNFGIALHYMLEMLRTFERESIESAYLSMRNRFEAILNEGEAKKIRDRVEKLFECERFMRLIEGKIYKEQPLIYGKELKQLDLMVKSEDRVIVIDYKSSKNIKSEHKDQVNGYKRALETIFDTDVEGYLCYLREDGVEIVEVD